MSCMISELILPKLLRKAFCQIQLENNESQAFFYKMIADYFRYIAESAKDDQLQQVSDAALENYEKASDEASGLEGN